MKLCGGGLQHNLKWKAWKPSLRESSLKEADDRPKLFFGGERFIAQQLEDGSWTVLDGRYREKVGFAEKSHEAAEQRAAALNAADARLRGEGREPGGGGPDPIDVAPRRQVD